MQVRAKRLKTTKIYFSYMCLRIKFCNCQRPGKTKFLKSLYPNVYVYKYAHIFLSACIAYHPISDRYQPPPPPTHSTIMTELNCMAECMNLGKNVTIPHCLGVACVFVCHLFRNRHILQAVSILCNSSKINCFLNSAPTPHPPTVDLSKSAKKLHL
jgi:hypothetical protein